MEYTRVNNDVNGNPRYVFHFFDFLNQKEQDNEKGFDKVSNLYSLAVEKSRAIGGKRYRGKDFGGGIVVQSYNIAETKREIQLIQQNKF